jgi:hypothetical protein
MSDTVRTQDQLRLNICRMSPQNFYQRRQRTRRSSTWREGRWDLAVVGMSVTGEMKLMQILTWPEGTVYCNKGAALQFFTMTFFTSSRKETNSRP